MEITKKFFINLFILSILLFFGFNCSSSKYGITLDSLDENQQLVYVKDGNKLMRIDAGGKNPEDLIKIGARIMAPVWSPDGSKVAFFSYGKKMGSFNLSNPFPASNQNVKLIIFDFKDYSHRELGSFNLLAKKFVRGQDKELVVIPPQWSANGDQVFVIDSGGIHVIDAKTGKERSVALGNLSDVIILEKSMIYTDGKNLMLYDIVNKAKIDLLEKSSSLRANFFENIKLLAASHDNELLAIAEGNKIVILDFLTMKADRLWETEQPIYWMEWMPGERKLLFLSGEPDESNRSRDTGSTSVPESGSYEFYFSAPIEKQVNKIYGCTKLDVRKATPSISPNGKHASIVFKKSNKKEQVHIIDLNNFQEIQLTRKGRCSWAVFRPN